MTREQADLMGGVLTLVIYRIQISTSAWWLSRYRFGPAEWLWRTLTYRKLQPLKRDQAQAADVQETISLRQT